MGKEEDLVSAVLERAREVDGTKKLACAETFELAQKFETEIIEIGRICNQYSVRICECQLGCFR